VRRSLRRPSHLVSHLSGRRRRRPSAPDRPRHLPIRPARPNGLLALQIDVARSFRRRLVILARGVFQFASGVADNVPAVPVDLDDSGLDLLAPTASWPAISTLRARSVDGVARLASGTFLGAVDVAWYSRFAAWLVWLLSRSTW
jgi:hypothetical protein